MKKKTTIERLQNLKTQREILEAKIQKMEILTKAQHRKQDTRRKILIGAYFLEQAKQDSTIENLKKNNAEIFD